MLKSFRDNKRAAFIPFIVAGHPTLEISEHLVDILVEEGADVLELGVPFSDAMADGPIIQSASEAGAKNFDSVRDVLRFAKRIHARHPRLSLVLFSYYNPLLRMGLAEFSREAHQAGITGVLVVDLPPEEAGPYLAELSEVGLKSIFLSSPTSAPERIALAAQSSTGFLYYVSRTGVTGVQATLSTSLAPELKRVREICQIPIAVGFGIANGEQAAEVAAMSDAVVVGSAFVKIASQNSPAELWIPQFRRLASEISLAVHQVVKASI